MVNASRRLAAEDVWAYVSTGEKGTDAPTTIVSVTLAVDDDMGDLATDIQGMTEALASIDFEYPFGQLNITCNEGGTEDNRPLFVYLTRDLAACSFTDYRGTEPALSEFATVDAFVAAYPALVG